MLVHLERLPPLISHASCVCIGLLLSFYLGSDQTANECFLSGKVFVAFPNNYFVKDHISPPGGKIHFGIQATNSQCLIKNSSATIIQNDPFVVTAFHLKSVNLLPEILNAKNKGQLTIIPDAQTRSLASCTATKITYGP